MSPRARMTLFLIATVLLVGAGVLFALGDGEEQRAPVSTQSPTAGETQSVAEAASKELLQEERAEAEAEGERELRRHDPRGDPDHAEARPRDERRLERIAGEAKAVAREFYEAFAAYELGSLDAGIRATFRSAATRAFARTLLAPPPPRVPLGAPQPGKGELGSLQFVALDSDPARRQVAAAELVGEVERDGQRSPIAIELIYDGGWRVVGISR